MLASCNNVTGDNERYKKWWMILKNKWIINKNTTKTFTSVILEIAMKKYQKSQPQQSEVNINIKVQLRYWQTAGDIN